MNYQGGNIDLDKDAAQILKHLRQDLNSVQDRTDSNENKIDALQKELEKYKQSNDDSLKDLLQRMKDNEAKTAEMNSSVQLLKTLGGAGSGNIDGDTIKIINFNSKGLLDALEILVENLRKECYAKFADRDEQTQMQKYLEDMNQRLADLETRVDNNEQTLDQTKNITDQNRVDIDDILAKLHDLNTKLAGLDSIQSLLDRLKKLEDDMKNKLDQHDFDNEIAMIRSMIGNIDHEEKPALNVKSQVGSGNNGGQFSAEEVKSLKSIIQRFPSIEEMLASLTKDFKKLNINELREQLENLSKLMVSFASKEEMKILENIIKQLNSSVETNTNDISRLMELLNNFKGSGGNGQGGSGASNNDIMLLRSRMDYLIQVDDLAALLAQNQGNGGSGGLEKLLKDLEGQLKILRSDFNRLVDETCANFKNHQDQINKKADKQDLDDLEARLMDKINEMIKKLIASFADRSDTLKRLAALEKNVKSLFELLMAQGAGGKREHEEDAMFTKKPLGGLSCASCERGITNLAGVMAEYQPWKKLPFREGNDRIQFQLLMITQYGPGFSKILSMMKPEQYDQSRLDPRRGMGSIDENGNNKPKFYDHSITVEMPQGVNSSSKHSARTGYHFYKNSAQLSGQKTGGAAGGGSVVRGYNNQNNTSHHMEESPPRVVNMNEDNTLPHLNVRNKGQL